jgi:hypothetical protein
LAPHSSTQFQFPTLQEPLIYLDVYIFVPSQRFLLKLVVLSSAKRLCTLETLNKQGTTNSEIKYCYCYCYSSIYISLIPSISFLGFLKILIFESYVCCNQLSFTLVPSLNSRNKSLVSNSFREIYFNGIACIK